MRIISFGDLYVDYYFQNGELIGLCGGKTNANIIANLSRYYPTAFLGSVGNDAKGRVSLDSLKELGIDTTNIKIGDYETKTFFIDEKGYTKDCPYCHRQIGSLSSYIQANAIIDLITSDDIIVIDNLNVATIEVIKSLDNMAFIDLGYPSSVLYKSLDEIVELLGNNRFKIINLNERVYNVFKRKFDIDSQDLYALLKPDLLIITRGKRGCDIISSEGFIKKEIENPSRELDTNGAGDAFFSEFIHAYLENRGQINEKMLSKTYMQAQAEATYVISLIGARTHLQPLRKITNYQECICKQFNVNNL